VAMDVNEQTLAAYNEAGHGIEAIFQGRDIYTIGIFPSPNGDGSWGGQTEDNFTGRHAILILPPKYVYVRLGRDVPQGFTPFATWEQCAFKLTGVEAEKRLCELNDIDSSTQRIAKWDVEEAKGYVARLPPHQAQIILDGAQARARRVVEDADCWKALKLLAQALIDVYRRAEKPYLTTREIHNLVSQVLSLPPLEDI
jgi:hypothetical protein